MSTHPRVGIGYDLHRLQPGGRLVVGGVEVSAEVSPVAHSDGDVLLHALVDALLGALGQGDIGDHFSDRDDRWKGAASSVFVEEAMRRVRAAGYAVGNVDACVLLERPKLGKLKPQIAERVKSLTAAAVVNVKAGTNEGCGEIGRGEAIGAQVVAILIPT